MYPNKLFWVVLASSRSFLFSELRGNASVYIIAVM